MSEIRQPFSLSKSIIQLELSIFSNGLGSAGNKGGPNAVNSETENHRCLYPSGKEQDRNN